MNSDKSIEMIDAITCLIVDSLSIPTNPVFACYSTSPDNIFIEINKMTPEKEDRIIELDIYVGKRSSTVVFSLADGDEQIRTSVLNALKECSVRLSYNEENEQINSSTKTEVPRRKTKASKQKTETPNRRKQTHHNRYNKKMNQDNQPEIDYQENCSGKTDDEVIAELAAMLYK